MIDINDEVVSVDDGVDRSPDLPGVVVGLFIEPEHTMFMAVSSWYGGPIKSRPVRTPSTPMAKVMSHATGRVQAFSLGVLQKRAVE